MAGVTDRPFRLLCRELGAGMAVSEMVSANVKLRGTRKSQLRIDHAGEPEPRSVQILGADPGLMADAARYNVERGAQIIDINMGCPAKKVCHVAAGSALLKEESLVGRILDAVVTAVDVPVTLKIRTGWDTTQRNGVNIARIAESAGILALAVHGRTRACGFGGVAEYDTIAAIKASISIPVIANGDIDSPQKARAVMQATSADAVMIGRAAQGRPWLLHDVAHYLARGEILPEPPLNRVRDIMLRHLNRLYEFYGEHSGVLVARKHISWYSKHHAGWEAYRHSVYQATTPQQQYRHVRAFFDTLINRMEHAA